MSVAGVAANPYIYNADYTRNRSAAYKVVNQSTAAVSATPSNITLHIGSEDDPAGKAIGLLGFPDGSSTSVFKGQNYTTDHPVFTVKTWDADGNMTETEIDASKVDPGNASLLEMMALNANRQLNGEEDFGDQLMMSAGRLHGDEVAGSYEDFFSKNNWMAEIKDFMDMQYQLGNMAGYLQYKKAYAIMQAISDCQTSDDSSIKTKSVSEEYSKALADYAQNVKNKIENGETETSYQIGGQSFTEKEWEKLISEIDEVIDTIKEEVKAEAEQAKEKAEQEKLRAETITNTNTTSETDGVTEEQLQELLKDKNSPGSEENMEAAATTRGSSLMKRLSGEGSAPYSYLAKDGVIEYNGVTFNYDYERNQITLGDVSNPKNCLNIPLSKGGSLVVNVDNLGDLSKAISMFSPEDIRRIMEAIAQYNKAQEIQQEIDEDTNSLGDSATEEIQNVNSMEQSGITDPNQSPAAPLVSESVRSTDQTDSSEEKGKLYSTGYNEDGI